MKITWYGQSAFRIEHGAAVVLIDPFLSDVPWWKGGWEGPAEGVTHVLLTHGHNDHVGDAAEICKAHDAMLVGSAEVGDFMEMQGVKKIKSGKSQRDGRLRRLHRLLRQCAAFIELQPGER